MAERRLVLRAMCGVTLISRSSMTKSAASKPLSPASVMASGLSGRCSIMSSTANRSAAPNTRVSCASTRSPVAVLHQGMADVTKLGLHAGTFAIEHGVGIAGRGMGLVAPPLTTEVDLFIAPAARWRFGVTCGLLGLEALRAGPGFHQRAVNREVIRREKLLDVGLCQDR